MGESNKPRQAWQGRGVFFSRGRSPDMTIKRFRPGARNSSHSARGHFDNRQIEGRRSAYPPPARVPNSRALNLSVILLDGVRPCSRRIMNGARTTEICRRSCFHPLAPSRRGWLEYMPDNGKRDAKTPLKWTPRFSEVLFFFLSRVSAEKLALIKLFDNDIIRWEDVQESEILECKNLRIFITSLKNIFLKYYNNKHKNLKKIDFIIFCKKNLQKSEKNSYFQFQVT